MNAFETHLFTRYFPAGTDSACCSAEAKRILLTLYLILASFSVSLVFLVISIVSEIYFWVPANVIVITICLLSSWLLYKNKFKKAKLLLVITLNLATFWSASIDPFDDGTYLFFIPVGISAFVLLDPNDMKTAVALVMLSTALFLLSYFDIARYYELPPHSPQYHQIAFLFTYFLSFGLSIVYIYFLVNLNRRSENELQNKERSAKVKNEQLQKANEALDRLVYSVSHDLRSPLNSILGIIDLVEMSHDPNEVKNYIQMIRDRIKGQNNYILEIIEYSRSSLTEVRAEKIELRKLVDEVVESLRFSTHAQGIEFRSMVDHHVILISDRISLWIILNNLIGNAIKYHDLSKAHPFIEIGYSGNQNSIYVQDNGIGIRTRHKKKIFDLFYTASDEVEGSGIGLFLIKEMTEKLRGSIEVESEFGRGTRFTIYLNGSGYDHVPVPPTKSETIS
jgi:signal transduction histidine kinase